MCAGGQWCDAGPPPRPHTKKGMDPIVVMVARGLRLTILLPPPPRPPSAQGGAWGGRCSGPACLLAGSLRDGRWRPAIRLPTRCHPRLTPSPIPCAGHPSVGGVHDIYMIPTTLQTATPQKSDTKMSSANPGASRFKHMGRSVICRSKVGRPRSPFNPNALLRPHALALCRCFPFSGRSASSFPLASSR